MPSRKLIADLAPGTPSEIKTGAGYTRALPEDLLRQASRRVEIIALIGAFLWVAGPLLGHLELHIVHPDDPRWAQFQAIDAVALISVAISLALYVYLRTGDHEPAFVMDLALGYMIAVAFGIAVVSHWDISSGRALNADAMISWMGPVVLMFAAIVPASPPKLLAAGFVSVSMNPLGMVIGQAAGAYHFGSLSTVLAMHYPDYLLLVVALVISRVVTRLGRQVAKEREMGSYQLGELLGRGGMGVVYLATHRMLARPAAIKLLRPERLVPGDGAVTDLAVARFRREAEAAAKLRSPHTIEIYDFGVTEDGTLYLVMELLEGTDLESLVRKHGPLPPGRVIYILRQVCESLEEAHAAGLVHRDIKPANIHIGRLGLRHDFVKVLDFGLVKSVAGAGAGANESLATAAGFTPGTPSYMAPEVAHGESADSRADLYSLGCVAYYLLTGRPVFEGDTPIQVLFKHVEQLPVPPSQRAQISVPPALEQVVLACLAKRPADRPQSAAELARALATVETAPWGEAEAARWWSAHGAG